VLRLLTREANVHAGILYSLGEYVRARGSSAARTTYASLVDSGEVLTFREISDDRVRAIIEAVAKAELVSAQELLARYGQFWVGSARSSYPEAFGARDPVEFLLRLGAVHRAARALPGASPPPIDVEPGGPGRATLRYDSPRRMCGLVRGIVEGLAAVYARNLETKESECMLRGDARCTFELTYS
jgi:Haem-NO-binding